MIKLNAKIFAICLGLSSIILTSCSQKKDSTETVNDNVVVLEAKSGLLIGTADFGTFAHNATSSKLMTFSLKNNGDEALTGSAS